MRSDARLPHRHWGRGGLVAVLVVLAVPFVFPTWWMVTSSLKPISEILRSVPTLWPRNPTLDAYGDVFTLQPSLSSTGTACTSQSS